MIPKNTIFLLAPLLLIAAFLTAHPAAAKVILEPGPDGLYAVPDGDRPAVPLEVDVETESPFVLHSLEYDGGRLVATLLNAGEQPVTAVAVEQTVLSPEGERLTSTRKTVDNAYDADPGMLERWRETGLVPPRGDRGVIYPGHGYRVELGGVPDRQPGMAEIGRMVLWVPMTIYLDTSFAGSDTLARRILDQRAARARVLARWSEAFDEALENGTTEMAALAALRSLQEELAQPSPGLAGQAATTRQRLLRSLDGAIRAASERRGSARQELESLARTTAGNLQLLLEHVPDGALEIG